MNSRYFICRKHKEYTDAGYRWAYWQLEDKGVVSLGKPVDVAVVLSQHDYWHPSAGEQNEWLCQEILPTVRQFLEEHRFHSIHYVDEEFLHEQWELGYEWREVKARRKDEQDASADRLIGGDSVPR